MKTGMRGPALACPVPSEEDDQAFERRPVRQFITMSIYGVAYGHPRPILLRCTRGQGKSHHAIIRLLVNEAKQEL